MAKKNGMPGIADIVAYADQQAVALQDSPHNSVVKRDPIHVTRDVLADLAMIREATLDTWAAEMRQISLAAAAHGEFQSAVKGYETLGKHLGAVTEGPQATHQHVHLHDADIREATTEELEAQKARIAAARAAKQEKAKNEAALEDLLA